MQQSVTILDHHFELELPYSPGHVITQGEANALNSAWKEGIRNRFTPKLKELLKIGASPESIKEEFAASTSEFSFSDTPSRRRSADKVTELARELAKTACIAAAARTGLAWNDIPPARQDAFIAAALERNPGIRAEAERRLAAVADQFSALMDQEL